MKAFLLKYRSSLLLFAVMFLFGWGSAAVVAKWQSDRETEETMHIEAAVDKTREDCVVVIPQKPLDVDTGHHH